MKLTFLGTNGWFSSRLGETSCVMLESKKEIVIFDAGSGLHALAGKNFKKPITLLISHPHLDHTSGLHSLGAINFSSMQIVSSEKNLPFVKKLCSRPFTEVCNSPSLEGRISFAASAKFKSENFELKHLVSNSGFVVQIDGKKVAYTGDTGLCDNLFCLASEADVLISECNLPKGIHSQWFHLSADQAAEVAKKSGVKKLFLTHFSPMFFKDLKSRKNAEKDARKIFPNTVAAFDGLSVNI